MDNDTRAQRSLVPSNISHLGLTTPPDQISRSMLESEFELLLAAIGPAMVGPLGGMERRQ